MRFSIKIQKTTILPSFNPSKKPFLEVFLPRFMPSKQRTIPVKTRFTVESVFNFRTPVYPKTVNIEKYKRTSRAHFKVGFIYFLIFSITSP